MAWKNYKKIQQRRKKGLRNWKNCTQYFSSSDHKNLTWRKEVPVVKVKVRRYSRWDRKARNLRVWVRDYSYFNGLTQEEFWQLQEKNIKESQDNYERTIHLSQFPHAHKGCKGIKQYYHRKRRAQSRKMCYYAHMEDEQAFDSIPNCDYFKGAIDWDVW